MSVWSSRIIAGNHVQVIKLDQFTLADMAQSQHPRLDDLLLSAKVAEL